MSTPCEIGANRERSIIRSVLWIDCSGGILVGLAMLLFADWLLRLFQLPPSLYYTIASANLCYGIFALVLASMRRRPLKLVSTLAIANAFWGGVCLVTAFNMVGHVSAFGLAHILAEGLVVFSLARVEWRHRALIATK